MRASLSAIIGDNKILIDKAKKIYVKSIELEDSEENDDNEDKIEVQKSEFEKFLHDEYRSTFTGQVVYES
jgi:hypothetical protein